MHGCKQAERSKRGSACLNIEVNMAVSRLKEVNMAVSTLKEGNTDAASALKEVSMAVSTLKDHVAQQHFGSQKLRRLGCSGSMVRNAGH